MLEVLERRPFCTSMPKRIEKRFASYVVQHVRPSDQDTQSLTQGEHSYFGSVELGSVSNCSKSRKSFITLSIAGQDVEIKTDTGAQTSER